MEKCSQCGIRYGYHDTLCPLFLQDQLEALKEAESMIATGDRNMREARKPKTGVRHPVIWVGRYKLGRRTLYAATAASTRARCQELIDAGPFYNTEPLKWSLKLIPRQKRRVT